MDLDPINIEQVQWLWLITRNMDDFQVQRKNWPAHVELSVKKRLDTKYISQAQHWYNTSVDAARFMAKYALFTEESNGMPSSLPT